MNIHAIARQAVVAIRTHTPIILTSTAVAGVITTAVLTAKAAIKADRRMGHEPHLENETKVAEVKQYVRVTWKCWLPPIGAGSLTIASIILAHYTQQKRYAALMGLYVLGEKAFSEYRESIEEVVDKNTGQKIREKAAEKAVNRDSEALEKHIFERGETCLVFDSYSGRYFKSDIETIRRAENKFNKNLIDHMYGSLNEFYAEIGIEGIVAGEDVGWNSDKLLEVDYEAVLTDKGIPALYIGFNSSPPNHSYTFHH